MKANQLNRLVYSESENVILRGMILMEIPAAAYHYLHGVNG